MRRTIRGKWRAGVVGALIVGGAAALGADEPTQPRSEGPREGSSAEQAAPATPVAAQGPDLSWWSVDGGGGTTTGGTFTLVGAVGEPEQGVSASSGFGFAGGVWAMVPPSPSPFESFADGFESGDTSAWSRWTPGP